MGPLMKTFPKRGLAVQLYFEIWKVDEVVVEVWVYLRIRRSKGRILRRASHLLNAEI